jgi:hypothetical protein
MKNSMNLWKRPPVRLTERERELIAFRFASPPPRFPASCCCSPASSRLLQLREGRVLLHALAYGRTVLPWQNYRLSPKLYLRAITAPRK